LQIEVYSWIIIYYFDLPGQKKEHGGGFELCLLKARVPDTTYAIVSQFDLYLDISLLPWLFFFFFTLFCNQPNFKFKIIPNFAKHL